MPSQKVVFNPRARLGSASCLPTLLVSQQLNPYLGNPQNWSPHPRNNYLSFRGVEHGILEKSFGASLTFLFVKLSFLI